MKKPAKAKKLTSAALVLTSEEAMVGTLNRYAVVMLQLAERKAAHEADVAVLQAAYDSNPEIAALRAEAASLESSVHLYAINHRDELFPGDKKSRDYSTATIGFRLNPPSVTKRIKEDSLEAIALRLDGTLWGDKYVDWTPSLRKEDLLRDRAELTETQLVTVGLAFKQEEKFFIEPKADSLERTTKPVEVAA